MSMQLIDENLKLKEMNDTLIQAYANSRKQLEELGENQEVSLKEMAKLTINILDSNFKDVANLATPYLHHVLDFKSAYDDCYCVISTIVDDHSWDHADAGLVLGYGNEICYALKQMVEKESKEKKEYALDSYVRELPTTPD